MSRYPSCFPDNFEDEILPSDVHFEKKFVYRVMKKGVIDREGFISTCEEVQRGLRPRHKRDVLEDPSYYSTSCNGDLEDARSAVELLSGHHPKAIIAQGVINPPACGPWQLTEERTGKSNNSHIDWWVYDDAEPQNDFKELNTNEN